MRYYSFFLPQYFQSKGLFDSTGRRINSFSSTLNQAFYVLEKIKGSVFPVKLYFLTFFNEIISFLTNFHTGRNYFCDPCCFRKIKNVFKSYLNNILFLKWKILPRLMMLASTIMSWRCAEWFMQLETPTAAQSAFVSVVMGVMTGVFGIWMGHEHKEHK